jgi:hypothetical protein
METEKSKLNRAEAFVDNFSAAVTMMMDNAPAGLAICFSIYARDTTDRTESEPDGVMHMESAMKAGLFDRATFKEYINDFYVSRE